MRITLRSSPRSSLLTLVTPVRARKSGGVDRQVPLETLARNESAESRKNRKVGGGRKKSRSAGAGIARRKSKNEKPAKRMISASVRGRRKTQELLSAKSRYVPKEVKPAIR